MRLLICGDRHWADRAMIFRAVKRLKPTVIIEGDAHGADRLAGQVGEILKIKVLVFPAQWETHGKSAGPIRNQQMLDEGNPT